MSLLIGFIINGQFLNIIYFHYRILKFDFSLSHLNHYFLNFNEYKNLLEKLLTWDSCNPSTALSFRRLGVDLRLCTGFQIMLMLLSPEPQFEEHWPDLYLYVISLIKLSSGSPIVPGINSKPLNMCFMRALTIQPWRFLQSHYSLFSWLLST